ncbi:MAG: cytidine deaminase [Saprospiraceae bacterium]|nr:cytidine deaminase [Saprospiraceae bacterium]
MSKIAKHKSIYPDPVINASDRHLFKQAQRALKYSYSPYSGFSVGVAVLNETGAIYIGTNIENASYPLCLCAERTALAHAYMSDPKKKIVALAVVCKNPKHELTEPGYPCGACRQVINELEDKQKSPIRILVGTTAGKELNAFQSIKEILPHSFGSKLLK